MALMLLRGIVNEIDATTHVSGRISGGGSNMSGGVSPVRGSISSSTSYRVLIGDKNYVMFYGSTYFSLGDDLVVVIDRGKNISYPKAYYNITRDTEDLPMRYGWFGKFIVRILLIIAIGVLVIPVLLLIAFAAILAPEELGISLSEYGLFGAIAGLFGAIAGLFGTMISSIPVALVPYLFSKLIGNWGKRRTKIRTMIKEELDKLQIPNDIQP